MSFHQFAPVGCFRRSQINDAWNEVLNKQRTARKTRRCDSCLARSVSQEGEERQADGDDQEELRRDPAGLTVSQAGWKLSPAESKIEVGPERR